MQLVKANFKTAMWDCPDWRPITGYENLYEVHWRGAVRNAQTRRLLRPGLSGGNYFTVSLVKDKHHKTHTIHALNAKHFISNPENKRCVNHKNGNKQDNHIVNLEWATHGENNSHAIRTGLKASIIPAHGIIQYDLDGNEVARFRTSEDPELIKRGFRSSLICRSCNKGMHYQHGGFRWAYINKPKK